MLPPRWLEIKACGPGGGGKELKCGTSTWRALEIHQHGPPDYVRIGTEGGLQKDELTYSETTTAKAPFLLRQGELRHALPLEKSICDGMMGST